MRILNWVKSKIKPEKKKPDESNNVDSDNYNNDPDTSKRECNDWPGGLLTIGTLGNSGFTGDSQRYASSKSSCSSSNLSNFTVEEVYKLQKELTRQLALKSKSGSYESEIEQEGILPLDKFLNCPSSLEIDRRICEKVSENLDSEVGDISPNTRMVLIKVKDILSGNHKSVNQKSFSFLLKKIFVCGGGFRGANLKDPIPETRMEKLLRTIIKKKLFSRSAPTTRKCLGKKPMEEKALKIMQRKVRTAVVDG